MGASISIADIYYKVQEQWQSVAEDTDWRLAVWVCPMENMTIIDRFMEIERSPAGSCDEVFFRFETEYTGDNKLFTQKLWEEYLSWFTEELPEEYDILKAMKKEGNMNSEYFPSEIPNPATPQSLWNEFLRFKSCITGMEERNFCIYFPPTLPDKPSLAGWFRLVLKEGVPAGIRLVTIDDANKRAIPLPSNGMVKHLKAEFDLKAAINNEMDKECDTYDSTSLDSRYRKQVRNVMEVTIKRDCHILDKEVRTLLAITNEMQELSVKIATPLVVSQAYYNIGKSDKSMKYADEAIRLSGEAMLKGDVNGYPIWKVSMFQKAAILVGQKEWGKAAEIYRTVAEKATEQQDAFYIMEGYRMCGYLMYELRKKESAFEYFLLSLAGGSYLEKRIRRESTFLFSAYLALLLGKDVRSPREVKAIEEQLYIWLGDDWESLIYNEQTAKSTTRRRSSLFG